jgi:hypothetical protein
MLQTPSHQEPKCERFPSAGQEHGSDRSPVARAILKGLEMVD